MKIIIVNGSNRKNGATATILNEMYRNLKLYPDVEAEVVNVADLHMNYCAGCCSCYRTGKCIYEDDAEKLSEKIEEADGVVFGSPTYACNVSAQMKVIIDRGHFIMEQLLAGKYAIGVVTYENYGGYNASKILNKTLMFSGAQISSKIIVKNAFDANPLDLHKMERQVLKCTRKLYEDIKKKHCYIFQRVLQKIIYQMGIRPFVIKKGEKYEGVVARWKN